MILLKATVLESATASQLEPGQELGELNKALADGLTLYQANQTKALNALLALLMKRYPDTPEPFYNMALHQCKQGLFTDALAHLAQAEAQCEYKQCSLPLLTVRSLIQAKIQ